MRRIKALSPRIRAYAEPYAGGAASALNLLAAGEVEKIYLNDADKRIYAAWKSILEENARFLKRIRSVEITLDTWHQCRALVSQSKADCDEFELGFATYFLNRTNRSGIVLGAGPIGGYDQTGRWLIHARFYRETMASRIKWLGEQASRIELSNLDGLEFIRKRRASSDGTNTFFFIDPPYVSAGSRLYFNGMTEDSHRKLAKYLCKVQGRNWALTYDDCDLIRDIYKGMNISNLSVFYSLQNKRKANEILITAPGDAAH